jgi:hypothetical protein
MFIPAKAKALESFNNKISKLNREMYYHKFVKSQRLHFHEIARENGLTTDQMDDTINIKNQLK